MNESLDLDNLQRNPAAAFIECGLTAEFNEQRYRVRWRSLSTERTGYATEPFPKMLAEQHGDRLNTKFAGHHEHWIEPVEPMYRLCWENTSTGETGVLMEGYCSPLADALVLRNEFMRTEYPAFDHWVEEVQP